MTVKRTLEIIVNQSGNAASGLNSITSSLGTVGKVAGGVALGGIAALGGGILAAGVSGLSMNNAMEQATATINAFTKDGKKTADILEMIKDRAAKTPFEFNEMATAAGALIPSAKAAGSSLEDLIAQAEILAASNPAQGLEGAAFALKEAVSGDFTSIIERFNLPRQYINQLKEEGVPNLEIVSMAMQELGLDTDLVSALANTAQGRWSTLKDTFTSLAGTITQPIFDTVSNSLGGFNGMLEANAPKIQAFANILAGKVQQGLDWLMKLLPRLIEVWNDWSGILRETTQQALPLITDALQRMADVFGVNTEEISAADLTVASFRSILKAANTAIKLAALAMQGLAWAVEKTNRAIGIAKGLWQNGSIIIRYAMDQIRTKWDDIGNRVSAGVDGWRRAFDGVKSVMASVISRFSDMASAARNAINSIPDWLIPGSPTPFEIGLRGIAKAAGKVNSALPEAFNGINTPTQANFNNVVGQSQGKASINLTIEYKPTISTATAIELESTLIPLVISGLRNSGVQVG